MARVAARMASVALGGPVWLRAPTLTVVARNGMHDRSQRQTERQTAGQHSVDTRDHQHSVDGTSDRTNVRSLHGTPHPASNTRCCEIDVDMERPPAIATSAPCCVERSTPEPEPEPVQEARPERDRPGGRSDRVEEEQREAPQDSSQATAPFVRQEVGNCNRSSPHGYTALAPSHPWNRAAASASSHQSQIPVSSSTGAKKQKELTKEQKQEIKEVFDLPNADSHAAGHSTLRRLNVEGKKQKEKTKEQKQESKEAIGLFDTDGSGSINSKEPKVACVHLVPNPRSKRAETIPDIDDDGNGTIEYEELLKITTRQILKRGPTYEILEAFWLFYG